MRIGVVDEGSDSVEVQGQFSVTMAELREAHEVDASGTVRVMRDGLGDRREASLSCGRTRSPRPLPSPGSTSATRSSLWAWGLLKLDFTGIAFASLFFCWSLTPSLLPRDWLYQGLIGGINAAFGYAVGTAIGWLVYEFGLARRPWLAAAGPVHAAIKVLVPVVSALAAITMLIYSAGWQRELSALMTRGHHHHRYIRTGGLSLLVAAALISLWRVLRDLVRWVARQLNKWLKIPRPAASAAGFAVVLVLVFMLVDGILLRVGYGVVNSIFSLQNNETRPGAVQPILPEKSGKSGVGRAVGHPRVRGPQLRLRRYRRRRTHRRQRRTRQGADPGVRGS